MACLGIYRGLPSRIVGPDDQINAVPVLEVETRFGIFSTLSGRLDRVARAPGAAETELDRAPAAFPSGNRHSKTDDVLPPQGRAGRT
jgi:hypothetical protein